MSSHPATRAYVARRAKEGLSQKEILRCRKRYVAREVYPCLRDARCRHASRGRPDPVSGCRACWPANDPPAAPGDLDPAC